MNFTDSYYNLFQKKHTVTPPVFKQDENYIMRFSSELPYYTYNGNSLTIIYFRQGAGSLIIENESRKIKNNKFIIANPNTNWEYINNKKTSIDVLSFVLSEELISKFNFFSLADQSQLLETPFEKVKNKFFFTKQTFDAEYYKSGKILNNIYNYSNTNNYPLISADEVAFTILENIYSEQLKAYKILKKIKATKKSTQVEVFKRLLTVYEYIHDNLTKKITIRELSLISGLSEYHLFNSFKRVFKKTPHQYINFQKMTKARELINTGKFSTSQVAFSLNFPDLPTFSKLYKKTYGIPPSFLLK